MAAPKEMEVCKICGAFLVVGDSQSRYEEHLLGKQHLGYDKVRKSIEELQVCEEGKMPSFITHVLPAHLLNFSSSTLL